MHHVSTMVASVTLLLAAAGGALAQDAKNPDEQPLRGPSVRDDTVPGESRRFTGAAQRRKDAVGANIPQRIFARAIDSLRGEKADPTIRLAQDQAAQIAKIERDLRARQMAFMRDHREELAELRKSATPELRRRLDQLLPGSAGARARQNAEAPGADEPPSRAPASKPTDDQKPMDGSDAMMRDGAVAPESMRERLVALIEAAPKTEDVHGSIWAILTPAQREHVEKQIERLKAETASRRSDAKDARPAGQAPAKSPDGAAPPQGAKPDLSNLPPRLRERWESMTPEQRAEAIKRLKSGG